MSPNAAGLCQALLDHQARASVRVDADARDVDAYVLTYEELSVLAGTRELRDRMNGNLIEIAAWCKDHEWPLLNSLVVSAKTRRPSDGYIRVPDGADDEWEQQVRACVLFAHYPKTTRESKAKS